ncbi:FAD-binding oxidoreductase [Paraburkholderia hospita]|uniref:FAD-binding oxidoreductase n=1 Tax=Paraburkholderia hospita TaxID=169430 RepID=UPI000B345EC9|nr:FAD-binding oxidoreductase [Paraburkholderia hospita]OUL77808.1 FAD-linked oxidase [Paraburkholderia hospita]
MNTPILKQRDGTFVGNAAIETFKQKFRGHVVLPGDSDYDSARKIWNASIDKRPGLIAQCSDVEDVVSAVKFARENQILVAIKGGGHNVAGRALCDDGIVIDLSAMNRAVVDPESRTVHVQGGALLGDIDRETHPHGLAVPTGVVSKTGIAGLTLGGGVGWLVRKYGLTIDNLLECEVVTATGDRVVANKDTNVDLFWALRGGGGNFGVVTSFLFQAYPVPTVLAGLVLYPREQAGAVLRHYRDFMPSAPEELTAYTGLISTPDGNPAVGVIACYCGDLAEGERVLAPLRAFGTPMVDTVKPMPFMVMQQMLQESFPDDTYNYWKSTFLSEMTDEVLDVIVEHANGMQSPLSSVLVEFYAGAASRVGLADTAFAQRRAEFNVGFMAQWTDAVENDKHIGWTRDMAKALEPYSSGSLLNFMSGGSPEAIQAAFGSNHARLVEVKTKYDPTNFFSINQNVVPRG